MTSPLRLVGDNAPSAHSADETLLYPSKDSHGNSAEARVKMPPAVLSAITEIAAAFGHYRPGYEVQDFILHAIHRHRDHLRTLNPEAFPNHVQIINSMDKAAVRVELNQKFDMALAKLEAMVRGIIGKPGGQAEARKMVVKVLKELADKNPDFWTKNYEADVRVRFSFLFTDTLPLIPAALDPEELNDDDDCTDTPMEAETD